LGFSSRPRAVGVIPFSPFQESATVVGLAGQGAAKWLIVSWHNEYQAARCVTFP
jgi:hypothetical protein